MVRDCDTDRCVSVCCVLVTDKGAVIGGLQRGTRRGKITSGLSITLGIPCMPLPSVIIPLHR